MISQQNTGLSAARNAGLELANGEFVAFVDSDDYIDHNMFKSMLSIARRDCADIVQCGVQRVNERGVIFAKTQMVPPFTFEKILNGDIYRAAWNKIYKRELFVRNQIHYPVGLLHEDLNVTCQLYYFAKKISWTNKHLYYWFLRDRSISQSISEKHIRDVFKNFILLFDFLNKKNIYEKYKTHFIHGSLMYAANLADRIDNSFNYFQKNEYERLHSILKEELDVYDFTSIEERYRLKSSDLKLYIRYYNIHNMEKDLWNKPKEELVRELKYAQKALFLRDIGGEDYQSFVNLDFNTRINRLFEWLDRYRQSFSRIALYGNSVVGRILARELGDALVVVADQAARSLYDTSYPVCLPEELPEYQFDCLIVCVLGREAAIVAYLRDVVGVDEKQILTFDLDRELPRRNQYAASSKSLINRITKGEPIIGSYPLSVQIQTVSACSANCYFCPYVGSWHQKNPGRMDEELYRKIIDQLAKYHIKKFCPYLENEPFLDKNIFERISYAVNILNPEIVEISTNISVLNDWHIDGLVKILSNVPHELRISFHGIDKDSYENVMKLNYEKSLDNVKTVVSLMQTTPLNVMIRGAGEPRQQNKLAPSWFGEVEYRQFWQRELAEFKIRPRLDFFTYHDRAGQGQLKKRGVEFNAGREKLKDFYCSRFDRWVHFLYTGEPILCCMDYNRETVFADSVKNVSVEKIFTSDAFVGMIKEGLGISDSKPNHICKRCISPGG